MGKLRPFVRKDSYMPNKKWIPFVIGNGYTTTDGASGPAPEYETVTGNPVSFNAITPFPLRQLSVAFSPVQDLHGYDAPWPAGGGVNKANLAGATIYETLPTWASASVDIDAEEITITGTPTGATSQFRLIRVPNIENGLGLKAFGSNLVNSLLWDGTNHTIQVVLTGMTAGTAVNIKFKFVAYEGQTAPTAWTPYSNLCPILGWDSLNVEQRGVNVWDEEWEVGTYNDITGGKYNTGTGIRCKDFIPCLPNTTYYYNIPSITRIRICYYDKNKTFLASLANEASPRAYATPANCYYMTFATRAEYGTEYNSDISINYPATDTAYHPYNPSSRSISISIGSTVYSGWVEVVTGVGEIDWVGVDGGSLTWKKVNNNSYRTFTATPTPTPQKGNAPSTAINVICDNYKSESFASASATNDNYIWVSAESADQLCIKDTSRAGMSVAEFKQYMTGMTIVYRLATPLTIQLTPQEVESLAGDNTMWSDANGDLTVEYRSN